MSQRSDKTKICPICDKEFHYLGYARHRAMHNDKADREQEKEQDEYYDSIDKEIQYRAGMTFDDMQDQEAVN